ncbi:Integrator complex subunit 6 [Smittium mucronatum]|uniref:Integrator complex subunit 6 n=1 Tax=Smittium mucronatum TaxID=133383 RepID=A0A1R0H7H9_9FUNG|nr:Integrator complex subunit 6 [Smittium mucronatum]
MPLNSMLQCGLGESPENLLDKLKTLKPQDTSNGGNSLSLNIPVNPAPWSDLSQEPFRWDQRLLTVFLHEPGDKELCYKGSHSSEYLTSPMSAIMGGNGGVFHVGSMKQAQKFVESVCPIKRPPNSKVTSGSGMMSVGGVVVNFEKLSASHSAGSRSEQKVMIYAPELNILTNSMVNNRNSQYVSSTGSQLVSNGSVGYFPIPESFWIDSVTGNSEGYVQNSISRPAHPSIMYSEQPVQWTVPPKFPFDKFQVDPSSKISQSLISATNAACKTTPDAPPLCWPVYIANSYRANNAGFPFGLLRANTARTAVNLFILPYNYPALFILLRRLESLPKTGTIQSWKPDLDEYLTHTPAYYTIPLKRAFSLYGMPKGLIGDDYGNSGNVLSFQKYQMEQRKLAKFEWDGVLKKIKDDVIVSPKPKIESIIPVVNVYNVPRDKIISSLSNMRKSFVESVVLMSSKMNKNYPLLCQVSPKIHDMDEYDSSVNLKHQNPGFKNEDGNGSGLNYKDEKFTKESEDAHSVPIAAMGVYQQVMAKKQAQELRDPLMDDEMIRQLRKPMFGNPYKKPPKQMLVQPQLIDQNFGLDPRKNQIKGNVTGTKFVDGVTVPISQINREGTPFEGPNEGLSFPYPSNPSEAPVIRSIIGKRNEGQGSNIINQTTFGIDSNSEIDGEAQINESASIEHDDSKNLVHQYTRFGWIQRRYKAPRYRILAGPWKSGDESWNVNPWANNTSSKNLKKSTNTTNIKEESDSLQKIPKKVSVQVEVPILKDENYIEFPVVKKSSAEISGSKNEMEQKNRDPVIIIDADESTNESQSYNEDDVAFSEDSVKLDVREPFAKRRGANTDDSLVDRSSQRLATISEPESPKEPGKISGETPSPAKRRRKAAGRPKKTPAQFKLYLIKQIKLDLESKS